MAKVELKKPVLICLYGYPGSGKSYVARNLSDAINVAHVSADRIKVELFRKTSTTPKQDAVANKLAFYIANEFLRSGVSVVFDADALNPSQRRSLHEMALRHKAGFMLIWLQMDQESAYARASNRDGRTLEGKYAGTNTRAKFQEYLGMMQNPDKEDHLVVSGKHNFTSQKSAIVSRLYQMNLVDSSALTSSVTKPELVNLIPTLPRPISGPEIPPPNF